MRVPGPLALDPARTAEPDTIEAEYLAGRQPWLAPDPVPSK